MIGLLVLVKDTRLSRLKTHLYAKPSIISLVQSFVVPITYD